MASRDAIARDCHEERQFPVYCLDRGDLLREWKAQRAHERRRGMSQIKPYRETRGSVRWGWLTEHGAEVCRDLATQGQKATLAKWGIPPGSLGVLKKRLGVGVTRPDGLSGPVSSSYPSAEEIRAMAEIVAAVQGLALPARRRVLAWASAWAEEGGQEDER